jgi:hypothetical protein
MSRLAFVTGIIFLAVMIVILLFADGPRRWYSSAFFAFIGTQMLVNVARRRRVADK